MMSTSGELWNLVRFPLLTPTYRLLVLGYNLPEIYRNSAEACLAVIASGLAPPWVSAAPGKPISATTTQQEYSQVKWLQDNGYAWQSLGSIPDVCWEPRPASKRSSLNITWDLDLNSIAVAAAQHQQGEAHRFTTIVRPTSLSTPFFKGYYWDMVLGVQGQGDDISYRLFIKPWVPHWCMMPVALNGPTMLLHAHGIRLQARATACPGDAAGQQVLLEHELPDDILLSTCPRRSEGSCEVWGKDDFFGIKGPLCLQAWHDAGLVHADGKLRLAAVVDVQ